MELFEYNTVSELRKIFYFCYYFPTKHLLTGRFCRYSAVYIIGVTRKDCVKLAAERGKARQTLANTEGNKNEAI